MKLADDFVFSQSSLQDFTDCRRRFLYGHILHIAWPAAVTEPEAEREQFLRLGNALHRMIQQHTLGISVELLGREFSGDLKRWWQNYLSFPVPGLPAARQAEVVVSAPIAGYRLMAKYDLLAIDPGERAVIVDWKASKRLPHPKILAERLQSKVYPYLLSRTGSALGFGPSIQAEQIEMVYWFAEYPNEPQRFAYSQEQCMTDERALIDLVEEIQRLDEGDFDRTSVEARCKYCPYRSLCRRGVGAGEYQTWDEETDVDTSLDIDFEQIEEVEY